MKFLKRQFKWEKLNIEETLNCFEHLMQLNGMWPKDNPSFAYNILGFTCVSLTGALLITTLLKVFSDFSNAFDVANGASVSMAMWQGLVKYTSLYCNKTRFLETLRVVKNPIFISHGKHLDFHMEKKLRISRMLLMVFLCTAYTAVIIQTVSAIFDKDHGARTLPLPFPLDMSKQSRMIYALVIFFQTLTSVIIVWSVVIFDLLVFTLTGIAAGQLEILRENLIHAADCSSFHTKQAYNQDDTVNNLLRHCVTHHIAIERLVKSIERTFSFCILLIVTDLVLGICVIGFNFLLIPIGSTQFTRMLFYLISAALQITLYCAQGNEVTLLSAKIRDACYMSEWTNCGPSIRKNLFLIMERSKRPFVLTAGKFVPLSLETLVQVFRTSFSYFTVLSNIYSATPKE